MMKNSDDLGRFEDAQNGVYASALAEIQSGRKRGHWMWFIFPQIQGLGSSDMARFYAIRNKAEAIDYLQHPVLGKRLIEISKKLLMLKTNNAEEVFGTVDSLKLRSCMTLFSSLDNAHPVFSEVINKFFDGPDEKTLAFLKS